MHKIDTSTASDGKFVDGNPNQGIKGTQVDSSWLNSVQAEILSPIDAAGITPSKDNDSQLLAAIKKLFIGNIGVKNHSGNVSSIGSTEVGFGDASVKNGDKTDFTITINNKKAMNTSMNLSLLGKHSVSFDLRILGYQSARFVANFSNSYSDYLGVYSFPDYYGEDTSCNVDLKVDGIIFGS